MKPHYILLARWLPLLALALPGVAAAFTVNIRSGERAIYLRVGDGPFPQGSWFGYSYDLPYRSGGVPQSGGAINTIRGSVPAAAVGNGVAQPLTGESRLTSDWEGYNFCDAGQTYVGGFFRGGNGAGTATLTAVVTRPLSNGTDTIPFSQIGWTASGNGDGAAHVQPIGSNTFGDGSKVIASFPVNVWQESCHSFYYANQAVVAAGTYTGRVTYTLAAP